MSSANRPFGLSLSDVWIFNSIHPSLASPAQHLDPPRLPSYLTHPYHHPLPVSGATLALVLTTSAATTATVVLCCTNARAPLVPEPTTRPNRRLSFRPSRCPCAVEQSLCSASWCFCTSAICGDASLFGRPRRDATEQANVLPAVTVHAARPHYLMSSQEGMQHRYPAISAAC